MKCAQSKRSCDGWSSFYDPGEICTVNSIAVLITVTITVYVRCVLASRLAWGEPWISIRRLFVVTGPKQQWED